jgi:hypothetical protein
MKKGALCSSKQVLRLCRDIHKQANDLGKLQPLVFRLHEVLQKVRYETRAEEVTPQQRDNPFDKIMVA